MLLNDDAPAPAKGIQTTLANLFKLKTLPISLNFTKYSSQALLDKRHSLIRPRLYQHSHFRNLHLGSGHGYSGFHDPFYELIISENLSTQYD